MSLLRTALRSSPRVLGRRFASTAPEQKSSNLPLYFIGAGVAGAGAYYYLEKNTPPPKPKQEKSPLDPENWKDFKLKKIIPYNHNTSKFVFELPNDEASLLPVASCLVVKSSDPEALLNDKGKPIVRPYTPISPPDQPGELTFLIKKYETGNASKYIHALKEGETLALKGPIPKFPYKENEFDQVALIGGGSGITPLYQLLTHALQSPTDKTKFTLLFSNVTEKDILLRQELDALKKQYGDKFDLVYLVDKPSEGWSGPSGFINADIIKKYVGSPDLKEKVKIFVCGPPGQVNSLAGKKQGPNQGELAGILKELGYTQDQVFKF
ncbi:ferredoxin reductase-like protein [Macrolepiota fuliginosa MF-IS2]|uniref:NADH-cytochrome b5 reductase n=1 Tax=Macrolepiota fuliginosa MF-IS2 TaxID=1400762 RepID=A0A9P5X7S1_9AGAR|nr:ferredoxin reductase-like protein [Macrolepiota fuliginosa MF-IS2]